MSFDNRVGNGVLLRINQMVADIYMDAWCYEWEASVGTTLG